MNLSTSVGYGSHMPVLEWLVPQTSGRIFEMGAGLYSTPYLFGTKREIVTYELDPAWEDHIRGEVGLSARHTWTDEMPEGHFSVAFLDGGTDASWLTDRREMFDGVDADFFVVHDLSPHLFCEDWRPWYGADKRYKNNAWFEPLAQPFTWIASDHDLPEGLPLVCY